MIELSLCPIKYWSDNSHNHSAVFLNPRSHAHAHAHAYAQINALSFLKCMSILPFVS